MRDISSYRSLFSLDTDLRIQENSTTAITLLNGDPVANTKSSSGGVNARVYKNGSWGFASAPGYSDEAVRRVLESAASNAIFLDSKAKNNAVTLPSTPGVGKYFYTEKSKVSQAEIMEYLKALDSYIVSKYPGLNSRTVSFNQLDIEKSIISTCGTDYSGRNARANMVISMSAKRADGKPVSEIKYIGGIGIFESRFSDPADLFPQIDELYEALQLKLNGVYAEKGQKTCILDPDLAGILAHEAIGHTVESDLVIAGSVAGNYMNKKAASEMVTLVDFAAEAFGAPCPIPVPVDDEGTAGRDAVIIENGILKSYLHNKESAQKYGVEPLGNARANTFSDEPLVRMRNTVILPGKDKFEDMIASVDDGYYLMSPSNGQADSTSEFMFAVTRGFEIKNGKLGRPILDTTISGVAFDVLQSITMIGDEFRWGFIGNCGKKQHLPVGMGGPAIKCVLNIG